MKNAASLLQTYHPPEWVTTRNLKFVPTHRAKLAYFPTPIEPFSFEANGKSFNILIKRDDLSDLTAGGNKIRKLEFIIPHVIANGHDWILSIGGTQSNHCRSVSAVSARLGLKAAHVLRKDANYKEDRPAEGNLLFHKLYDTKLYLVPKIEFVQKGASKLLEETKIKLMEDTDAKNPFLLPVGGSILEGLFGYIECIREIEQQLEAGDYEIDEIFFSCGSGGTAAGMAIGRYLSTSPKLKHVTLTAYLACDNPEYFHGHVNNMIQRLGLEQEVRSEEIIRFVSARGLGYGQSTDEELSLIMQVAKSSGVLLDGTYTGKAMYGWVKEGRPEGTRSLFVHTGGIFSLFDQGSAFAAK